MCSPNEAKDDFDEWSSLYDRFYPKGSRSDAEFRASRLLVLTSRAWINRIDSMLIRQSGQSRARWQVLFAISFAPQPATLTQISQRAHLQWPTMVRVVEAMEREGLLDRADNPDDGRSKLISLTSEGEATIRKIQPIIDRERAALLQNLTDNELQQVAGLLDKVYQIILKRRLKK